MKFRSLSHLPFSALKNLPTSHSLTYLAPCLWNALWKDLYKEFDGNGRPSQDYIPVLLRKYVFSKVNVLFSVPGMKF